MSKIYIVKKASFVSKALDKVPTILMLTDEDRMILKEPKHANFKGYFTDEAIKFRIEEEIKEEELRIEALNTFKKYTHVRKKRSRKG